MKVCIHQPNYLPWLGFFNKISQSDTYVVFDDVQYPRGKDWANRNHIKTNNGKLWLTVPVSGKGELKKPKKTPYIIVRLFFFCLGYKNIEAPPN